MRCYLDPGSWAKPEFVRTSPSPASTHVLSHPVPAAAMRHSALPMSLHYIRLRVPATKLYNIVILRAPRYDAVGTKLTSRDDPLLSAYLAKADEVDAVSPERASALGGRLRRPRLDHITSSGSSFPAAPWVAKISCMTCSTFSCTA